MDSTDEFSFVLKPSENGVGVFTTRPIPQGTHLRLFGEKDLIDLKALERPTKDVPENFRHLCIDRGATQICPPDFGHMHIGWYLNHSKQYNAVPDKDYEWSASRDIRAGEEILIDYNALQEPEEVRDEYYKH